MMDDTPRPPRSGRNTGLIVILLVIAALLTCCCALVAAAAISRSLMGREIGSFGLPRVFGGVQATRELDQAFPVEGEVTLDLTNQVGDVFVEGTDDGQVVVEALVTAYGANAADAEAAADRTEVIATQEDAGRIRVIGRYPQSSTFRGRSPNVRFTVRVPRNCAVVVQNNVGRVQVDDIEGTVNARTDVGDVEIRPGERGPVVSCGRCDDTR